MTQHDLATKDAAKGGFDYSQLTPDAQIEVRAAVRRIREFGAQQNEAIVAIASGGSRHGGAHGR